MDYKKEAKHTNAYIDIKNTLLQDKLTFLVLNIWKENLLSLLLMLCKYHLRVWSIIFGYTQPTVGKSKLWNCCPERTKMVWIREGNEVHFFSHYYEVSVSQNTTVVGSLLVLAAEPVLPCRKLLFTAWPLWVLLLFLGWILSQGWRRPTSLPVLNSFLILFLKVECSLFSVIFLVPYDVPVVNFRSHQGDTT